ncbi:hypothetical protein [Nonomuraea dietziae]|uniref:hypothetical protein n=1 Tax=Nonomuraea dietziae TaxID=65515 RepID=UPI0034323E50
MATVLTGMQAKGLIDRQPSLVHAKVVIATLADAGRHLLDETGQEVNVLEKAFVDRFTRLSAGSSATSSIEPPRL